jgi:CBS domain-containing protein
MTPRPITVQPDTSVVEVARILLERGISAVPVVDGERIVGIVSEGDLMRRSESGTERRRNPLVVDGVVQLWGVIGSEQERRALRAMAARIDGVRGVEDHLRRGS